MPDKRPLPDWDALSFRLTQTDCVYRAYADTGKNPAWDKGEYLPFGDVSISPAAAVLSYGIGIFEGLKAERTEDERILLFRPDRNALRFQNSARQMQMPPFPAEQFLSVVDEIVRKNERFIPPKGKGTFYIRPLQFAHEPILGLRTCTQFETLFYGSPVGAYFKGDESGVRLRVLNHGRVAPGGSGSAKAMGNYPAGIRARMEWKEKGFDDVLYLDARHLKYATETSGSNVFALLKSGALVTPPLDDQILPGITRASVIELAKDALSVKVEERPLSLKEILDEAQEVFCTGTAWTVRSVSEIVHEGGAKQFPKESLRSDLYDLIRDIQTGKTSDTRGWTREVRSAK